MPEQKEQSDFWTIFVSFQVCAGNMSKDDIIAQSQKDLENMSDGSDYMSPMVSDAVRDDL